MTNATLQKPKRTGAGSRSGRVDRKRQRSLDEITTRRNADDQQRAARLLEVKIEYISSETFSEPDSAEKILGPFPASAAGKSAGSKPPPGTPAYLAELYSIPLLTKEQEQHLFRRMNYLKYQADVLRGRLNPDRAQTAQLDQIETMLADALGIRNQIVRANLRLVVSIAKKVIDHATTLDDAISDGNVPLIRAVEIFDFERGTRFSTYATWAVRNSLYRSTPRNRRILKRFAPNGNALFDSVADDRNCARSHEGYHSEIRIAIEQMFDSLDSRDRTIVKARFGLENGGRRGRFREIAETLGISTERVRQLLGRALYRMADAAECESIEMVDF